MTADERLTLIRAKIQRAKEHIPYLNAEVIAFLYTPPEPYIVATERDPQTREVIYYLASAPDDIPIKISSIIGDVVNNLRSALDHLACQLFLVANPSAPTCGRVYFPICDGDAAKYQAELPGKVKGLRKDAIEAIDALKPYKGGHEFLWKLHKLNNIDKHRMLVTVGAAHVAHSFPPGLRETLKAQLERTGRSPSIVDEIDFISVNAPNVKCPLKKGDELFRSLPDAKVDQNMKFRIDVVFGEPDILYSTTVAPTLLRMAGMIDDIIVSFKPFLA